MELKAIYFSIFSTEEEFLIEIQDSESNNYKLLEPYNKRFKKFRKEGLFKSLIINYNQDIMVNNSTNQLND